MKKSALKKILLGVSSLSLLAGCNSNENVTSEDEIIHVDMSVNDPSKNLQGNDELDWLSKTILEKGADFMKSGVSTLALYAFKTACMEMGIDVRDATTKKIDQIISKLDEITTQISKGFSDLTKKAQQVQDRDNMNTILNHITEIKTPIMSEMIILEDLARKEQDPNEDQDEVEKQKETFINEFKTRLNFYGLSSQTWSSVEILAKKLTSPNPSKPSQSLMDLYDNTLGANDIWDYQGYAPRMAFVQQCSFLINSMALLAKLEAAKEISKYAPGDSNIKGIEYSIEQMCSAVGTVNAVFQKELGKLQEIKDKHDDAEKPTMSHLKRTFDADGFVHITSDYTVSAYIATIGLNNVVWKNTVDDFYADNYSHCFKTYVANQEFYNTIYSDYSFYISNYQVEDGYNLKYYLRDLGFRLPSGKQEAFDEAIGIYKNIDVNRVARGFLRGTDFYAYYRYYDWYGSLQSKNYCRVGETFWNHYDDETMYEENINKKFIAFMNEDNATLNGTLDWTIGHRDGYSTSELIDHFYRGDSYNYGNVARYSIHW